MQEIDIPNSVRKIGDCSFWGCKSISKIKLPESITEIGWGAFKKCSALKEINIPRNLRVISMSLFQDCSALQHIIIPDNVEVIEKFAFHKTGLNKVVIPFSVNNIGEHAFCNSPIASYSVDNKGKPLSQEIDTFFSCDDVLYRNVVRGRWSSKNGYTPKSAQFFM